MSLVSEALKKAEREAAAREASARGLPAPFDAPLQPYRSRNAGGRNRHLVAALALTGGAAAIAIALLLFRPEGEKEAPVKERTAAAPESLAVPFAPPEAQQVAAPERSAVSNPFARRERAASPSLAPALLVESPAPMAPTAELAPTPPSSAPAAPAAPAAPGTTPGAIEPKAPPLAAPPLPKTTQRPPPPSPSGSEPQAAKPPAAPAKARSNGPGDYLRSVEFADGSKLELGGIVYSEAAPFAYLNGRLVGVGEFVLGRRIDRIDRDKVILTGESGEITLRLKAP